MAELPKYFYFRVKSDGLNIQIEDASDTDVVEVVRCKDCKYSYEGVGGWCCSYGICVDCIVREDFFCGDGERRKIKEFSMADELVKAFNDGYEHGKFDAVKHGEWMPLSIKDSLFYCSNCNAMPTNKTRFCPNCGAKMEASDGRTDT